jgi:hypothetical protein
LLRCPIRRDPDFDGYQRFHRKWIKEMSTLRVQPSEADIRFYYSGIAQAFLLDRISPAWKTKIFENKSFLEDLLNEGLEMHAHGLP